MITVAEYFRAEQAYLVRNMLENAGIAAFVQHASIHHAYGAGALFPVEVQVDEEDYEEARKLIESPPDLTREVDEATAEFSEPERPKTTQPSILGMMLLGMGVGLVLVSIDVLVANLFWPKWEVEFYMQTKVITFGTFAFLIITGFAFITLGVGPWFLREYRKQSLWTAVVALAIVFSPVSVAILLGPFILLLLALRRDRLGLSHSFVGKLRWSQGEVDPEPYQLVISDIKDSGKDFVEFVGFLIEQPEGNIPEDQPWNVKGRVHSDRRIQFAEREDGVETRFTGTYSKDGTQLRLKFENDEGESGTATLQADLGSLPEEVAQRLEKQKIPTIYEPLISPFQDGER